MTTPTNQHAMQTASMEQQEDHAVSSYPTQVIEPTTVLQGIADNHHVTVPAVALNYSAIKGIIPKYSHHNTEDMEQSVQSLRWQLTKEEIRRIEEI